MSSTALAGAVELLDRSLAYTRLPLAAVRPEHLGRPTPCRGWPMAVLLAHMDDGLDAWTEAASGRVSLVPSSHVSPVQKIRDKACALLGWWLEHPPEEISVGERLMPAETLIAAAALEITLHGWDLQATVGERIAVPPDMAAPLLAIARVVVGPDDRRGCFDEPLSPGRDATESDRLLAYLGRS